MSNGYQGFEVDICRLELAREVAMRSPCASARPKRTRSLWLMAAIWRRRSSRRSHQHPFRQPHTYSPRHLHTPGQRPHVRSAQAAGEFHHRDAVDPPAVAACRRDRQFIQRKMDGRGLEKHLRTDCFPIVAELCETAEKGGTTLAEPFQGQPIGAFVVLAPTYQRYLALLPEMERTPAQKGIWNQHSIC